MNKHVSEYIWFTNDQKFISETQILNDFPELYFSDFMIKPCFICSDYSRKNNSYLVLCETLDFNENPTITNTRYNNNIFHLINYDKMQDNNEPFFIFTQEYSLSTNNHLIFEEHLHACLHAGLNISKVNNNIKSFDIGPCYGITAIDQLYMARFILEKIAFKYNILVSYKKNIIYFSTKETREKDGINIIYDYIKKLQFQNISCKIPIYTLNNNSGYFEILNPTNNDLYIVSSFIYKTCCLL